MLPATKMSHQHPLRHAMASLALHRTSELPKKMFYPFAKRSAAFEAQSPALLSILRRGRMRISLSELIGLKADDGKPQALASLSDMAKMPSILYRRITSGASLQIGSRPTTESVCGAAA